MNVDCIAQVFQTMRIEMNKMISNSICYDIEGFCQFSRASYGVVILDTCGLLSYQSADSS